MDKNVRPVVWLLAVIAVVLVAGFFGDEIGRWLECGRMSVLERAAARLEGYCPG